MFVVKVVGCRNKRTCILSLRMSLRFCTRWSSPSMVLFGSFSCKVEVSLPSESSCTICSTRPSRTDTMIADSRVSRNTMKNMGTENRFFAMGEGGEVVP